MIEFQAMKVSFKYILHVIFHPFDGFWDIKHEKRGNIYTASIILFLYFFVSVLSSQATGYILKNPSGEKTNIIITIAAFVIPFILWCVSNWSITTLMDGKGTLKDIYITTAYSLFPLIWINISLIIISHLITLDESGVYMLLQGIGYVWFFFLVFAGLLTIHEFTFFKTLATCVLAVIGMGIMIYLAVLFLSIMQQMVNFILIFQQEIITRR